MGSTHIGALIEVSQLMNLFMIDLHWFNIEVTDYQGEKQFATFRGNVFNFKKPMKNSYTTLVIFVLFSLTLEAQSQDIDEDSVQAAADAYFMYGGGRQYQRISPIIKVPHVWKDWENSYSDEQKLARTERVNGLLNFIDIQGVDEDGKELGDTLEYTAGSLHYLDFDGDGKEDLFFAQNHGEYKGRFLKIYKSNGKKLNLKYQLKGMIVAMGKDDATGALWFTLYDYPCCDGYVHTLETYTPTKAKRSVTYRLSKVEKFVEPNTTRLPKNIPEAFTLERSFKTNAETAVFFRPPGPMSQTFVSGNKYRSQLRGFAPFALVNKNATGVVLHEIEESGSMIAFVRFDEGVMPISAIKHLERKSYNVTRNEIEQTCIPIYYGWVQQKNIVIK